jgi:hypothetical protein
MRVAAESPKLRFFVNEAETSLAFYTQTLGFASTGIISTKAVRGSLK